MLNWKRPRRASAARQRKRGGACWHRGDARRAGELPAVFTLVAGNFAVATILGHRIPLLSVLTYQTFVSETGGDPVMQSTLASVSIGLVAAVLFLQRWIVSRGRYEIVMGRGAKPRRLNGAKAALLALAAAWWWRYRCCR